MSFDVRKMAFVTVPHADIGPAGVATHCFLQEGAGKLCADQNAPPCLAQNWPVALTKGSLCLSQDFLWQ